MTILKLAAMAALLAGLTGCYSPPPPMTAAQAYIANYRPPPPPRARTAADAPEPPAPDNLIFDPVSRVYCAGYGADAHCDLY